MAFWLMKNEPEDYSIEDLEHEGKTLWDGCRNYQVRNMIRDEMQIGDLAIFYHSNAKPSGPAGVMEICSETYADPTQWDPEDKHYDPKSPKENPRWYVRDVKFVEKFKRVVPIKELRETEGLKNLKILARGNRLSVTPITEDEYEILVKLGRLGD
jgi:predicted RNA-binding protein with PUA-like domain